jgi:hypothetical protein
MGNRKMISHLLDTFKKLALSFIAIAFGGWLSMQDDRLIACIGLLFILVGALNANFYWKKLWCFLQMYSLVYRANILIKRILKNDR